MAKQAGPFTITGTIENLCFYEMEGQYYVRMKSSLTGKRVKKDPAFARTMQYAGWLKLAAKAASVFYRTIPKEERCRELYRKLTGKAMSLLKEGVQEEQLAVLLASREPGPAAAVPQNPTLKIKRLKQISLFIIPAAEPVRRKKGNKYHQPKKYCNSHKQPVHLVCAEEAPG